MNKAVLSMVFGGVLAGCGAHSAASGDVTLDWSRERFKHDPSANTVTRESTVELTTKYGEFDCKTKETADFNARFLTADFDCVGKAGGKVESVRLFEPFDRIEAGDDAITKKMLSDLRGFHNDVKR